MKIILQYSGTNSKCLLTFNIINSLPLQFEIGQNIRLVQSIRSADPKRKGVEILREQCWMKSDIEKLREKKWSGLLLSQFLEMDKLSFDIKRYQNSYKIKGFYLQFPLLETLEQKTARADQVSEFIIYNKNSLLNKNQIPKHFNMEDLTKQKNNQQQQLSQLNQQQQQQNIKKNKKKNKNLKKIPNTQLNNFLICIQQLELKINLKKYNQQTRFHNQQQYLQLRSFIYLYRENNIQEQTNDFSKQRALKIFLDQLNWTEKEREIKMD